MATSYTRLKVRDLISDGENHRHSEASIAELAESIKRDGLLQPIGVEKVPTGPKTMALTVLYGHRRLAACKLAGLDEVDAIVYDELSRPERVAIRMAENVDRLDLNPVEEALATSQLVAAIQEQDECTTDEAIRRAAERLGRSRAWVIDRVFINRFGKKARELIASGRLPLAQAREIAKIGDDKRREAMAEHCAGSEWQTPRSLDSVRNQIKTDMARLDKAPWRLDVAFAGKPACAECEQNSANAGALFDDGQDERSVSMCLNLSCFQAKGRSAETSITAGLKKAEAKLTVDGQSVESVKLADVAELVPKAVKPATFAARARAQIATKKPGRPAAASVKVAAQKEQPAEKRAEDRFRDECSAAVDAACDAVMEAVKSKPVLGVLLCSLRLLDVPVTPWMQDGKSKDDKLTKFRESPAWKAVLALPKAEAAYEVLNLLHDIAMGGTTPAVVDDMLDYNVFDNDDLMIDLAIATGADIKRPDLAAILAEEQAKNTGVEAAAKSGGKKKSKKATKE